MWRWTQVGLVWALAGWVPGMSFTLRQHHLPRGPARFTPAVPLPSGPFATRTCPRASMGSVEGMGSSMVALAPGAVAAPEWVGSGTATVAVDPGSSLLLASDLSGVQVGLYFGILLALIGIPIGVSLRDQMRIRDFQEKRQRFVDAIESEIAELKAQGDEESLATSRELREKLAEVYQSVEEEKERELDAKYLGFNKFLREFQEEGGLGGGGGGGGGLGKPSDAEMASRGSASEEDEAGNRYARRMTKKRKKKKID